MASLAPGSRTPTIAFIGFMGAGKTRAAKGAAAVLGVEATDVDSEVERELGKPVAEIFATDGEARFREAEERLALEALERGGLVSLGGGAVESARVREALGDAFVAWCRISEEAAWARCEGTERPLAKDREAFAGRLAERDPIYAELADAVLTDGGERMARLAAPWLEGAASLPGARLAWASSSSGEYPAIVAEGALGAASRRSAAGSASRTRAPWSTRVRACPVPKRPLRPAATSHARRWPRPSASCANWPRPAPAATTASSPSAAASWVIWQGSARRRTSAASPWSRLRRRSSLRSIRRTAERRESICPRRRTTWAPTTCPQRSWSSPAPFRRLPPEELAAGFAEVVKTALIAGGELWERVRSLEKLDAESLGELVFDCARVKIDVVAEDERDSGRRQVLNLGHTVGHAIEAATGYGRYRHGEAVALGLLAALRLSGADGLRAEVGDLLARGGLPTELDPDVDTDACHGRARARQEG